MQKIYLFFYRVISNSGNIKFAKIELTCDGDVTNIAQFKPFEDYILTLQTDSTLVEITGCMYLRESEIPLTNKPPKQDVANNNGKKTAKLPKSK